jgi:hypothetical protein
MVIDASAISCSNSSKYLGSSRGRLTSIFGVAYLLRFGILTIDILVDSSAIGGDESGVDIGSVSVGEGVAKVGRVKGTSSGDNSWDRLKVCKLSKGSLSRV